MLPKCFKHSRIKSILVSAHENYSCTSGNVAGNVTSASCGQSGLNKMLSSQLGCLKANEIIFIMIRILVTLEDQSERCTLKNLH